MSDFLIEWRQLSDELGLTTNVQHRFMQADALDFGPGVELEMTCVACPLQFEGTVDGNPAYFRARWEHWSFTIVRPDEDPVWPKQQAKVLHHSEGDMNDGAFAGSWMDVDKAAHAIKQGIAAIRAPKEDAE